MLAAALLLASGAAAGLATTGATAKTHDGRLSVSEHRAADQAPGARRRPVLLLIPGGGFVDYYDDTEYARDRAGRRGFVVKSLRYPLFDPLAAWHSVRNAARLLNRRGRDVYAYGESAGGTLAALLAERGLVSAATVNAPASDLTRWSLPGYSDYWASMRNGGMGTRRLLSPALHPTRTPIMIQQSETDTIVPGAMNRAWAAHDPRVWLRRYAGNHVIGVSLTAYAAHVRGALGFLHRVRALSRPR